jgi:hypothetical protein
VSASLLLRGYTVLTFGAVQQMQFTIVLASRLNVLLASITITSVTASSAPSSSSSSGAQRRLLQQGASIIVVAFTVETSAATTTALSAALVTVAGSASFVTQLQLGGLTALTGVSMSAPPTTTTEAMQQPPFSSSSQVAARSPAAPPPASLGALGALAVLVLLIAGAIFWWRRRRAALLAAAAAAALQMASLPEPKECRVRRSKAAPDSPGGRTKKPGKTETSAARESRRRARDAKAASTLKAALRESAGRNLTAPTAHQMEHKTATRHRMEAPVFDSDGCADDAANRA